MFDDSAETVLDHETSAQPLLIVFASRGLGTVLGAQAWKRELWSPEPMYKAGYGCALLGAGRWRQSLSRQPGGTV